MHFSNKIKKNMKLHVQCIFNAFFIYSNTQKTEISFIYDKHFISKNKNIYIKYKDYVSAPPG